MREKFLELRELFSDPKKWTRGEYARDKNGKRVYERSNESVRWCAIGGCRKVSNGMPSEMIDMLSEALKSEVELEPRIVNANDQPGGRKIILRAIDKVLESV